MIYLSGHLNAKHRDPRVGLMLSYLGAGYTIPDGIVWAADNGCYTQPDRFTVDGFLKWLDKKPRGTCLFAVAPDVVGDAEATLERALPVLPLIQEAGYRAAFVAQDGAENDLVPWHRLDCLFIGGTTEWKVSERAYRLVADAKALGRWVHVGRVNSHRRLRAFANAGADSADGTFLTFGPDKNWSRLVGWLDRLDRELTLGVA